MEIKQQLGSNFNPMVKVPETDDEVENALRWERNSTVATILIGIYYCQRKMGKDVESAYKATLTEHLKVCGIEI